MHVLDIRKQGKKGEEGREGEEGASSVIVHVHACHVQTKKPNKMIVTKKKGDHEERKGDTRT